MKRSYVLWSALLGMALTGPAIAANPPPASPEAAEPALGRLFMTPDRRAALERQRQTNRLEALAAEGDTLTMNGIVRRSSGRTTQWINQRAQHDAVAAPLKVGEAENRTTQERTDIVPPGAIRVRPAQR